MANKTPNFNERMRAARDAAELSLMDVAFELRMRLPRAMWGRPWKAAPTPPEFSTLTNREGHGT